jgi:hypothetical protein
MKQLGSIILMIAAITSVASAQVNSSEQTNPPEQIPGTSPRQPGSATNSAATPQQLPTPPSPAGQSNGTTSQSNPGTTQITNPTPTPNQTQISNSTLAANPALTSNPAPTTNSTQTTSPTRPCPPASQSPTPSQPQRAGVGAEAFVRPGVSAEQLRVLAPGGLPDPCRPPRDFVLHPDPGTQPRRVPAAAEQP